jgi:hypothetical protein
VGRNAGHIPGDTHGVVGTEPELGGKRCATSVALVGKDGVHYREDARNVKTATKLRS